MSYAFKSVDELTFTDDFMFGTIMKNPKICKEVIERLLHIAVGKIEYPSLQKTIAPFYESKGIRLDVYAADNERIFDIEMQTSVPPALAKRTRYYQSLMDRASWTLTICWQVIVMINSKKVILCLSVCPTHLNRTYPYIHSAIYASKIKLCFWLTNHSKYSIMPVHTTGKKTRNYMLF